MPIDRSHAFASGKAYPRTVGRTSLSALDRLLDKVVERVMRLQEERAAQAVWDCFTRTTTIAEDVLLGSHAWCVNRGRPEHVQIKPGVVCRGVLRRDGYGDGTIVIHEDVYIGDDVLISCMDRVEIGAGALIAHGVQVFDNDSHPTDPEDRSRHWRKLRYAEKLKAPPPIRHAPILIGPSAWVGMNSLVMKGVTIGEAAIVAAGSVVIDDVPPFSVAAGNPARVVRSLVVAGAPA